MSKPRPSRANPGTRDRHRSQHVSWNSGHTPRPVATPPPLAEGQARCPVCRQAVATTSTGYLRKHPDLFGGPCTNRDTGERSWRSYAQAALEGEGA